MHEVFEGMGDKRRCWGSAIWCMTLVGDAIGVDESSKWIRDMLGKKFECKKTMLIAHTQIRVEFSGCPDVEERTEAAA